MTINTGTSWIGIRRPINNSITFVIT